MELFGEYSNKFVLPNELYNYINKYCSCRNLRILHFLNKDLSNVFLYTWSHKFQYKFDYFENSKQGDRFTIKNGKVYNQKNQYAILYCTDGYFSTKFSNKEVRKYLKYYPYHIMSLIKSYQDWRLNCYVYSPNERGCFYSQELDMIKQDTTNKEIEYFYDSNSSCFNIQNAHGEPFYCKNNLPSKFIKPLIYKLKELLNYKVYKDFRHILDAKIIHKFIDEDDDCLIIRDGNNEKLLYERDVEDYLTFIKN